MRIATQFFLTAVLLLSFWGTVSSASTSPAKFTYKDSPTSAMTSFDSALDKSVESFGYRTLKMEGSPRSGFAVQWVNRIYLQQGENVRGRIFVKSGLSLDKKMQLGKIYELEPTVFVTGFPSPAQGQYLVFFSGIRRSLVEDMSRALGKTLGFNHARFHIWSSFFGEPAWAEGKNYYCSGETPANTVFSTALGIMKSGGACIHDIGAGVWQSTGGFVKSLGHMAMNLGETWRKIKDEVSAFGNFFANFQESWGEFKDQIASLPPEIQAKILCELAGNVGAGTLISMLTAGAGSVTFAEALASALTKVSLMREFAGVTSLTTLAEKIKLRANRMRETKSSSKKWGLTKGQTAVAIKTLGVAACNDLATLRGTRAGFGEDLPTKDDASVPAPGAQ